MPTDPRDYKLDLSGQPAPGAKPPAARPFIGVKFACCGVYQRLYRDADGRHYRGRCPRCGRPVTFVVAEGGTDSRFFVVS
jgi:hypothetical protein